MFFFNILLLCIWKLKLNEYKSSSLINVKGGDPLVLWLACWTMTLLKASSNCSDGMTFFFEQKGMNPISLPLWSELYHCRFFLQGWLWQEVTYEGWYATRQRNQINPTQILLRFDIFSCYFHKGKTKPFRLWM